MPFFFSSSGLAYSVLKFQLVAKVDCCLPLAHQLIVNVKGPASFSDFSGGQGFAQQDAQAELNWGEPISAPNIHGVTRENIEEQFSLTTGSYGSINSVEQTEQVMPRSLGEKFGILASVPQLNTKQGRSLAESIKQKIWKMSQKNIEHQPIIENPEPVNEPLDEWDVPHSPQWPKLNAEDNPEQWPNEIPGTRAPNAGAMRQLIGVIQVNQPQLIMFQYCLR